ncbi:MAG: hypothetical protein FJX77_12230, partial [Armatimonadetes bacterium]|nr:hypothetical protein [Armatimonadota bacterium]
MKAVGKKERIGTILPTDLVLHARRRADRRQEPFSTVLARALEQELQSAVVDQLDPAHTTVVTSNVRQELRVLETLATHIVLTQWDLKTMQVYLAHPDLVEPGALGCLAESILSLGSGRYNPVSQWLQEHGGSQYRLEECQCPQHGQDEYHLRLAPDMVRHRTHYDREDIAESDWTDWGLIRLQRYGGDQWALVCAGIGSVGTYGSTWAACDPAFGMELR